MTLLSRISVEILSEESKEKVGASGSSGLSLSILVGASEQAGIINNPQKI